MGGKMAAACGTLPLHFVYPLLKSDSMLYNLPLNQDHLLSLLFGLEAAFSVLSMKPGLQPVAVRR